MATTSKYNRSEIMRTAWEVYRIWGNRSFSFCLKHAWKLAKDYRKIEEAAAQREAQWLAQCEANRIARLAQSPEESLYRTMAIYYASGAYSGD